MHLIRNSVEAMPGGGELGIEVAVEPEVVRIILNDSGHGLDASRKGSATDPFYTTKMVGTGMGLTLVKRIIEDHGGSLRVDNRSVGGVRATVELPRGSKRGGVRSEEA